GPIKLNSRLRIDDSLTIQGPGASSLAIDGQSTTRLFFIGGGNVTISGMTLQNGLGKGGSSYWGGGGAGMGGAIFVNAGSLTATGVVFNNNKAQGGSHTGAVVTAGGGGFGGDAPQCCAGASGGDLFGSGGFAGSDG